jgi:hypothetical protein
MRGERISLARSEQAPAGTTFECEIEYDNDKLVDYIDYWLNFGKKSGLLQWRNSGMGRFSWEKVNST